MSSNPSSENILSENILLKEKQVVLSDFPSGVFSELPSSGIAMSVQNLSKAYTLTHNTVQHTTAAEAISHFLKNPFQKMRQETFWALNDISFDIQKGDIVGVIGRNGAGKSTLLKVMSRITEPTAGKIDLYGRVGSLLEVGTGFHQELTGRENIFLNGAILGMKRPEIQKHFEAIVEFAEVGNFLDTPVKRYSSGMYVRLAFAVAAHLNPEILIVDEVLAVGDAAFQKKCMGKMQDVAQQEGRTVLFVSHNMQAIRTLCSRCLLMHHGELLLDTSADRGIQAYSSNGAEASKSHWKREGEANSALSISNISARLAGRHSPPRLMVDVVLESVSAHKPAFIALDILDSSGTAIMQALPSAEGFIRSDQPNHHVQVEVHLPPLVPALYGLTVWTGSHNTETLDEVKACAAFEIHQSPTPNRTFPHSPDHGSIVPDSEFEYHPLAADTLPEECVFEECNE